MSIPDSATLLHSLSVSASRFPEKPALRAGAEELSYGQFYARILSTAAALRQLGVEPGDRVLFSGPNHIAIPIVYFAAHALNAIAVPVPPETPEHSCAALAADCLPKLVVSDRDLQLGVPTVRASEVTAAGAGSIELACRSTDLADLLYTTGTTGARKGVALTHAAILAAARNMTEFIGNRPEDVEVVPLPLSHSFGLGRLRSLALTGHTIVLEPGVGSGVGVIRRVLQEKATGLAMVPAGFEILRQVTRDALGQARSHLRYIEIGSAPMRPQTRAWLTAMLPETRICHHYGLTEASRAAFVEYHADGHRPGAVGKASPNVTITICGEDLQPVSPGESGEVVVSGGMLMREYWNRPELTAAAFCPHGLRTGDIGSLDADGYMHLLGRKNDIINVGGRKVNPDEVEDAIRQMEGVRDAACIGAPDPLVNEHVKAFIVADRPLDVKTVAAFLRHRIEDYKVPQTIELVDSVPRTTSGKLQRQLLREAAVVAS